MVTCLWDNCGYNKIDSKELYEHIQAMHVGYKRQGTLTSRCKWIDCTFTSERRDRMRSHVLCHINSKLYECDSCFKGYKWKHDLYAHQRKIHGKEKGGKPQARRKSQTATLGSDMFPSERVRRNTLSDINLESLSIQNQKFDQQLCNPESFCVASSNSTSPLISSSLEVQPITVRRHSVNSIQSIPPQYQNMAPNPMSNKRRLSATPMYSQPLSIAVPVPAQYLQPGMINCGGGSRPISPMPSDYSMPSRSPSSIGQHSPMPDQFVQQYNGNNFQMPFGFDSQNSCTIPAQQPSPIDFRYQEAPNPTLFAEVSDFSNSTNDKANVKNNMANSHSHPPNTISGSTHAFLQC